MSLLTNLHGTFAVLLICSLIFVEETGVPLPLAPGDVILVAGGVLIGLGNVTAAVYFPLVMLATVAGALVGHTWAGAVGHAGLAPLARRVGASGALERASRRLAHAGVMGVFIARLIPGLRVFTTLVAGALGVPRGRFLLGLIPAATLWVAVFTGLGYLAGLPLLHVLGSVEKQALRGAVLLSAGAISWVAVSRLPVRGAGANPTGVLRRPWRLAGAIAFDLGAVGSVVVGTDTLIRALTGFSPIDGLPDAITSVVIATVFYAVAVRWRPGYTVGEALFGLRSTRRDPQD